MFVQFVKNVVGDNPALTLKGPWSSVLYVDNVRGSDVTGTRGDDNLPFATIQAALNAMLTDDLVLLAPQVFILAAPLTIPASVIRGACSGQPGLDNPADIRGLARTIIGVGAGVACEWDFGANLGLATFTLANMYLGLSFPSNLTSPTVANIRADGTSYANNTFLSQGLFLDHVQIFDTPLSITAKYMKASTWKDCRIAAAFSLVNSSATLYDTTCPVATTPYVLSSDTTDPKNTSSGALVLVNSTVGGSGTNSYILMSGQASFTGDARSSVGGFKGSALVVNGATSPSLSHCGYVGTAVTTIDFASAGAELPDTATVLTFDMRGARLYQGQGQFTGGPTTVKFKVGGAAGNFQTIKLDSCTALPGVTFTADAGIHMTMRGASAPQAVYQTPGANGDIVPPTLGGTINLGASVGARTWVQLGYAGLIRTGAAPDYALLTPFVAATDPCITAMSTTGLTFGGNVVAGNTAANWQAVWK